MKKYLLLVMVCILLFPLNVNASQKSEVKTAVKQYFKLVKKSDFDGINKMAYSKQYGIEDTDVYKSQNSLMNYIKKYNKRVTYKISSVKINGEKATVKMKVKYVDSEDVYSNLFLIVLADTFAEENIDADDYMDKAFAKAVKMTNVKMKTRDITAKFQKKKGKWLIRSKNLANIAVADLIHSAEVLSAEFEE